MFTYTVVKYIKKHKIGISSNDVGFKKTIRVPVQLQAGMILEFYDLEEKIESIVVSVKERKVFVNLENSEPSFLGEFNEDQFKEECDPYIKNGFKRM